MLLHLLSAPTEKAPATHTRSSDGASVRIATLVVADTAKVHLGKGVVRLDSLDGYVPGFPLAVFDSAAAAV